MRNFNKEALLKAVSIFVMVFIDFLCVAPVGYCSGGFLLEDSKSFNTEGWVATDSLGRSLPVQADTGPLRSDKIVGMFYYLWHGDSQADRGGAFTLGPDSDVSKAIDAHPGNPDEYNPFVQREGTHYWGESEAGYYRSDDPWVLRRNLTMLAIAGVDFVFFDGSNGWNYESRVDAYCQVADDLEMNGIHAPRIAWLVRNVQQLYESFYKQGRCRRYWFFWDGKPLLMPIGRDQITSLPQDLRDEVTRFFTIRYSWAWMNPNEPDNWQWIDTYPQDPGWVISPSVPEQIPVAKASHASNRPFAIGSSYHNGRQPPLNDHYVTAITGTGAHFEEQWTRAHQVDPRVVTITQWNEWIGGCFRSEHGGDSFLFQTLAAGQCGFIDEFNREYSRDIEPMRGGYTDNFYYQTVSHIRRFKGMPKTVPSNSPQIIDLSGGFSQWDSVRPVFHDPRGDTLHRDWESAWFADAAHTSVLRYVNKTGRNDIVEARAAYDAERLYFYVRTEGTLTPSTDPAWMQLLLDSDQNSSTGWLGYDFLVNADRAENSASVHAWRNGLWMEVAAVPYRAGINQIQIAIPREIPGQIGRVSFDFHWVDNVDIMALSRQTDLTRFFTDGDNAPDRRFNFRFE
ncbi:MAG: hypothetical protein HQK54_05220 [Oligoflexales bacterium]|nr:hypothetical protein [Oligoflexales bacterium]